ncbi:MAG: hypothetical protein ABSC03_06215 [Verrucomicrobiota bacterium]|jgi:hypothetical protein
MQWDKDAQLRHSATCLWPACLAGGRRAGILRIDDQLRLLGYDGCVASLPPDSIMEGWKKAGWIEVSPNRAEIRLTLDGAEQLARWQEEDRLWRTGVNAEVELPKRLKAGEPATNLRRISQVLSGRTIECVHDPYTRVESVVNLLKVNELGTPIERTLRLLTGALRTKECQTLASFLCDVNKENGSNWQARTYTTQKPHRRFLVCTDGTIVTCGASLNSLDKDEILEVVPKSHELAKYDRKFFEQQWRQAALCAC